MATNYTAGDLNVSIFGDSVKAEKSIDNIISKLNSLQQALTVFSNINSQSIGTNLSQTFTQISTALNGIDTNGITKLNSLGNATKYLQQFITETQKINSQELDSKLSNLFGGLNSAVNLVDDKTLAKLEKIGNSVSALSKFKGGSLKGLVNPNNGKNSKNGGFGLLNIAGWTSVLYLARRLGSTVANILQKGADYTETLNLWEVAMKGNNDQATDFVNKMNEAYGISKKTLMNAQATFKNMLGSLGNITDAMAYQLSEGVTQMAVDYASLYNVNFEQAFTKFQAALAGQVRPIRSVSGYDITENTLYQLYQTLGGTKTIRQLSITEKRLLSILAIFKQMESSGAIGDLGKTLSSFANQSRVMAESWQEVLSYGGLIITHLIEESGLLSYINGLLIFIGDVLEAVASDMGAIKSYGDSIFGGTENSALDATNAVEELQGKLLGFDKFRVMNSQEESDVSIDETLSNALSSYTSIIDNVDLGTAEIVDNLKQMSGLFDENGVFQPKKWQEIVDGIKDFGLVLGAIVTSAVLTKIIGSVKNLSFNLESMSNLLIVGVVYAIFKAIDAFKEGDIVTGVIATTIAVLLIGALVALKIAQANAQKATLQFNQSLETNDIALAKNAANASKSASAWKTVGVSLAALTISYSAVSGLLDLFKDEEAKKIASWCAIAVGAIMALVAAIVALKASSFSAMLPVILAGVGTAIAGVTALTPKVEEYAVGASNIDSGTMFVAGESGKTEMVYNGGNGRTNVANIQQMKSAFYQALFEYGKSNNNSQPIVVTIDGQEVFYATRKVANQNGLDFSNVR